jgi:hypothetical protein
MKNQSLIISILTFILLINFSINQYSSFGMELDAFQERCLSEYYKSQTVIIIETYSATQDMQLEVKAPDGRILFHNVNSTSLFSLNTAANGFYSICTKNLGRFSGEINLSIKSGVSANDFSSVAKSKDLEPIDYELDQMLKRQSMLNHFTKISQEKQNQFSVIYKNISSKIIFYSLLMIAGMIVIGVVETLYLKRFMERRKII